MPGWSATGAPREDIRVGALRAPFGTDLLFEAEDVPGLTVGVVVTDTAGRAWREGQTDIAIGAAGLLVAWGVSTAVAVTPALMGVGELTLVPPSCSRRTPSAR